MCGIYFILGVSEDDIKSKDHSFSFLLNSRGPDIIQSKLIEIDEQLIGLFRGCVLWLQGGRPQEQPVVDEDGNIFLWNGDNLSQKRNLQISDTTSIYQQLREKSEEELLSYLASIEGPWSFIYFSSSRQRIYFGRDVFGRHSLLWTPSASSSKSFILSSVSERQEGLQEVPALGIYFADIRSLLSTCDCSLTLVPYKTVSLEQLSNEELKSVRISNMRLSHNINVCLCRDLPSQEVMEKLQKYPPSFQDENLIHITTALNDEITLFTQTFKQAIQKRVTACPTQCKDCTFSQKVCDHPKFAVMFSGGLDSALIALFLSKCLPEGHQIDLLNVSFTNENSFKNEAKTSKRKPMKFQAKVGSPDRESGLICWKQLLAIDPSRSWNFVEINITAEELESERQRIIHHLIAPHSSVLDDSIGCALYFCARGEGLSNGVPYTSPARVVFSGLGADEQLAGYSRHRGKFAESGWEGLLEEVDLEMRRIYQRNCGRDDRVLSHHGRTARFPYLDEDVVNCLNSFPMWKKANLYMPRGIGEKLLLRVVAAQNSLTSAAILPKRAIQFGSRIAKLENRKEKGGDMCQRLQS